MHAEPIGAIGTQAQLARIPLADGTLVATPAMPEPELVPSLLAASDVLGTGWFAAVAASVGPGKTVAVVGDGAVGLLGVLAARQLGAERVIAMSRREPRQKLALEFGATDIVTERGDDGVARIKDLTGGLGAHSAIEDAAPSRPCSPPDDPTSYGRTDSTESEHAMHITRGGIDTQKGPPDWFTGDVYIDTIAAPAATSTFGAAAVHFAPGARTAWHTHPHGQTIFVTEGIGLCQREGGPVEIIRPGDRVFFEPRENHWHGAAPNRFMVHIAIQQSDDAGSPVTWGRHVTDTEYRAAPNTG